MSKLCHLQVDMYVTCKQWLLSYSQTIMLTSYHPQPFLVSLTTKNHFRPI